MDAGPEPLVVKMSRGEQLHSSLTREGKHAAKTGNLNANAQLSHSSAQSDSASITLAVSINFFF